MRQGVNSIFGGFSVYEISCNRVQLEIMSIRLLHESG